jgi:hypothetical protein
VLAAFTLLAPILIAILCAGLIPSSDNMINADTFIMKNPTPVNVSMLGYGKQSLAYKVIAKSVVESNAIKSSLREHFKANKNYSIVTLEDTGYQQLNEYVLKKRKESYKNTVGNYFGGIELTAQSNSGDESLLRVNAYFSSMAFHSAGAILNEINR